MTSDGSRYTIEDRGSERVLRVGGHEHPTYYTERLIRMLIERKGVDRAPLYFPFKETRGRHFLERLFAYLQDDFNDPNTCCTLGYHSYDLEPGDQTNGFRERRYVMAYASWISPGLFGPGFEDVTALSHEIVESLNDPFVGSDGVHGITPWWLSINGNCQNDLETGDVIEGLPHATFPMTMNGFTYHPQNEALLQWFEFQSPSDALGGAYSYPNMGVLTAPSAKQKARCQP